MTGREMKNRAHGIYLYEKTGIFFFFFFFFFGLDLLHKHYIIGGLCPKTAATQAPPQDIPAQSVELVKETAEIKTRRGSALWCWHWGRGATDTWAGLGPKGSEVLPPNQRHFPNPLTNGAQEPCKAASVVLTG